MKNTKRMALLGMGLAAVMGMTAVAPAYAADAQQTITKANKTLSDMTALLDEMDARHKAGGGSAAAVTTTTPVAATTTTTTTTGAKPAKKGGAKAGGAKKPKKAPK